MSVVLLTLTFLVLFLHAAEGTPGNSELFDELFKTRKYNKEVFPILQNETSVSETLEVRFGLALINIEFDEQKSTLTAHVWNRLVWNDTRLAYDAKRFGKTLIRVSSALVWKPDITLYNSMDFMTSPFASHYHVLVYPNGMILWVPPSTYKVQCDEDITYWPWDVQNCNLVFGSWVHSDYSMETLFYNNQTEFDMEPYESNKRWVVKEHTAIRQTKYYSCCKEPYSSLVFNILFQRRAPSKAYILLVPTVVACLLTLAIFCLPPLAPERLSLAFINIIVIVLHLLYFEVTLPLRNNHPKIASLLVCCLIVVAISVFIFVLSTCLLRRQTQRKPPKFLSDLASGIFGSILCVSTMKKKRGENIQLEGEQETTVTSPSGSSDSTICHQCYQVLSLFDRLLFVIFLFVFIGLLATLS